MPICILLTANAERPIAKEISNVCFWPLHLGEDLLLQTL